MQIEENRFDILTVLIFFNQLILMLDLNRTTIWNSKMFLLG